MIKGKEDITDKEFKETLLPLYNHINSAIDNIISK